MTLPSDPLLTDQVFFCNFSSLHRNPTHTFINRLHLSSCCIGGMPGVPGTCPCTESTVDPKDAAHAGAASKCARAPSICRLCHCQHRLMPPVTRPACIGGMPGVPGTCCACACRCRAHHISRLSTSAPCFKQRAHASRDDMSEFSWSHRLM